MAEVQPLRPAAPPFEKGLFDLVPCGLVLCDTKGLVLRVNGFFRDMSGLPAEMFPEASGVRRPFHQYLTRPSRFIFNAQVLPLLDHAGEVREIALDIIGPDGDGIAVLLNANRDKASGQDHFALFPAKDRREHERQLIKTQKALTKSNDYLQLAERLARMGHWHADIVTQETYWSPEIYNITGHDPETYVPRFGQGNPIYHEDDRDSVAEILGEVLRTGNPFTFGKRIRCHDTGEIRYVQASGVCECDGRGIVTGLFGVFHDITDIARANESLEKSEARYRLLADHANDIITIFDLSGTFEYLSPAVLQVLGYTPDELIGRNVRDVIHPDDYAATQAAYQSYVVGKDWDDAPHIQYRALHKTGRYVWAEAHPTIIFDPSGTRIVAFQDVVRDITDQKAVEEALAKASVDANAAAEAKAQFLATMSHELRTPLTSIIGFSSLLRDLLTGQDELRRHSQRIHMAGQGLLSLINDILDHSKLDAGQLELDLAPADVGELVADVADLMHVQAEAKGLALIVEGLEALPPALMVDEIRLRQILLNLIGNAIKFTGEGRVTVTAALKARDHGDSLHISVRDTGVGISPDGQAHLFERFSQVDRTAGEDKGGTGLGLLICKQLVELMGGRIGVKSQLGEGSEFALEIPVRLASDEDIGTMAPRPTGHILVVDDQEPLRDLMIGLLAPDGHTVDVAADGAQALQACLDRPYDLIFMDLNMPVMDGVLATKGIRATCALNARTPIVALSAAGSASRRQLCLGAGMNDFLTKPVNPARLSQYVADWLDSPALRKDMDPAS